MHQPINLLYFSPTGTTARVVQAIASGMGGKTKTENITLPRDRKKDLEFGAADLVIVGVPVYGGRIPQIAADYFSRVKGNRTPVVLVAVYGNRDYDDALLELKNLFEGNGFIAIAAGAFIGEHSFSDTIATGRPDSIDLEIAAQFGRALKEKRDASAGHDQPKLAVKGNYPYKERKAAPPMAPVTDACCIACGRCAKRCPMGAIDRSDYAKADAKKCIRCCSCIKNCPQGAKSMVHEAFVNTRQFLIENCRNPRREPEIFM
jgi:ferredoxin